ncbi:MAG: high-potential iron-sulfur protein [Candidatus Sulfobium sp.]
MSEDADNNISRRTLLKAVAVAAGVSLASTFTVTACSAKATKAAMEYQDKPQGDEQCSKCKFFIPGGTPKAKGTCQVVQGLISPHGWCTAFTGKSRPGES